MRVVTVLGNRPQFVKAAALSRELQGRHDELLVHTGQHYDAQLSEIFLEELSLPPVAHWLGVHGGTNSEQVARMTAQLVPLLKDERPDAALVYGDTNSTLAGAIAAQAVGVPLVHIEAGMRSFDLAMPEEVNRIICDRAAALLLCPSDRSLRNLQAEGVAGTAIVVGDVMGDAVRLFASMTAYGPHSLDRFAVSADDFLLLTAHRVATVDSADRLELLVELAEQLPLPTLFPLHPRTAARLSEFGLSDRLEAAAHIRVIEPLGYLDMLNLVAGARAVLTDSGGLQKESLWLGTQCITLRPSTEWVETVESGWNTLVDLDAQRALAVLATPPAGEPPTDLYGAGQAAVRCVDALEVHL